MSEIKTLKFPGDVEPREIVDAKAREDISKLSDEIANIPSGADGKSAYQYAVDGGYTGTEEEFAAKLAEEMPDALPNPNALTFTGAVEGSYDGSEALTVDIPSVGGAQPDWNQNDATAADYVKNRPGGFKMPTGMVINFDGNTAGLETKTVMGLTFYKISNQNPYKEQFVDANVVVGGKTRDEVSIFDDQNGYVLRVDVEFAESEFGYFYLMCDGDTGLWFAFGGMPVVAFSVTQTNSGYIKLPADVIGGGIPHSNLLSLGTYNVNVSSFTSADIMAINDAIQSGDYSSVFLYKQTSNGNKSGNTIQVDANSYLNMFGTSSVDRFELYGIEHVAAWKEGDELANIYDRHVRYYNPNKVVPIKSSTHGSNKVFNITVDDSGTLKATEVT